MLVLMCWSDQVIHPVLTPSLLIHVDSFLEPFFTRLVEQKIQHRKIHMAHNDLGRKVLGLATVFHAGFKQEIHGGFPWDFFFKKKKMIQWEYVIGINGNMIMGI